MFCGLRNFRCQREFECLSSNRRLSAYFWCNTVRNFSWYIDCHKRGQTPRSAVGLRYRQVVTLTRVLAFVILSWVVFSSLSMLYFLNPQVFMITLCVNILLFLVGSTFCYSKIYFALRYRQTQVCQQQSEHGRNLTWPLEGAS